MHTQTRLLPLRVHAAGEKALIQTRARSGRAEAAAAAVEKGQAAAAADEWASDLDEAEAQADWCAQAKPPSRRGRT